MALLGSLVVLLCPEAAEASAAEGNTLRWKVAASVLSTLASALVAEIPDCHCAPVLLRKVLPLLVFALISSGCTVFDRTSVFTREPVYRKVRITDLQGRLIADWVAEGRVWSYGKGYRFNAVERRTGGPYPVLSKYPQGRKVTVDGPNIVVMPTGKPLWLYEIEARQVAVSVSETRLETGLQK